MPISYKQGNWFGLPELGITEFLGGNKASTFNPTVNKKVTSSNDLTSSPEVLGAMKNLSQQPNVTQPPVNNGNTNNGNNTNNGGTTTSKKKKSGGSTPDVDTRDQEKAAEAQRKAYQAQIDSEYDNLMGGLSNQESSVNTQLPITEGQITQSYGDTGTQLGSDQATSEANLAGQQATAEQATGGVLNQTRRTYNELTSGASKFGGSAGEAYGELLGRSTADTTGQARNALTQTITGIKSELGRVKSFYDQKKTDLTKNMNLAIEQARKDVRDQVATINQNRNSAQSWKASQNMQALANFQQNMATIKSAAQQAQTVIDQWNINRQDTLNAAAQDAVKQFKVTLPNAVSALSAYGTATGKDVSSDTAAGIMGTVGKNANDIDWKSILGLSKTNKDNLEDPNAWATQ